MKFTNSKKVGDYAARLLEIEEQASKLRKQLADLKEEANSITEFLGPKFSYEPFQTADKQGYLLQVQFSFGNRSDVDLAKVRSLYEKLGKTLPLKKSSWVNAKVDYVRE